MKALSIRQPWAWLIVNGYKPVENRTWSTKVRGPVLIHAGKTFDHSGRQSILELFPDLRGVLPVQCDVGGIVGAATLIDCVERYPSPWFMGPFGFVLQDARPLAFHALKGELGFFEVPEALELQMLGRVAAASPVEAEKAGQDRLF